MSTMNAFEPLEAEALTQKPDLPFETFVFSKFKWQRGERRLVEDF